MFGSEFDVVVSGCLPLDQIHKIGYVWKMIDTNFGVAWASVMNIICFQLISYLFKSTTEHKTFMLKVSKNYIFLIKKTLRV